MHQAVLQGSKYYEVSKNGSTKPINTLGKTGGDLWIKTKDENYLEPREALSTWVQKLYRIGKNGLVDAKNTVMKSLDGYVDRVKGLIRIQDAAKTGGTHLYRATSDGAFRTGKAITAKSNELVGTQQGFQQATR